MPAVQHGDARGDVSQRQREVQLLLELLHRGKTVAQHEEVVVAVADLLRRVLRTRVEQHRAQADLQRLLGHARRAIGRTGGGKRGQREDQGAPGRGQRGDRARVGHPGAGY
jgi:hypothetical protein